MNVKLYKQLAFLGCFGILGWIFLTIFIIYASFSGFIIVLNFNSYQEGLIELVLIPLICIGLLYSFISIKHQLYAAEVI
jgi:hypothetical protein